ncbi:MAG: heterodisulfide reductase-related iron-sulfur binding cluster [Alitiscatomonas sp.]
MNNSGIPGMALHQAISFFSPMMSVPETPAVFWPGCALLNLDPAILKKTLEILARTEPEIRLAAGCCGQPSFFLFPEKYPAYRETLERRLKKSGVKRIYTACPNCTRQLHGICGIQVIPSWSVLAGTMTREDLCGPGSAHLEAGETTPGFIWHDPHYRAISEQRRISLCTNGRPALPQCCELSYLAGGWMGRGGWKNFRRTDRTEQLPGLPWLL